MTSPQFVSFVRLFTVLVLVESSSRRPAVAAGPGRENDFQGRRVLIIGIDGCRRDVMRQLIKEGSVPNLAKLEAGSLAYWNMEAGGEPTGPTNQPTSSGPGWSTLLTGVFADKHGVRGNDAKFSVGNFKQYPHLFKRIRDAKPASWLGSIVGDGWPEINTILLARSGDRLADAAVVVPHEKVRDGDGVREPTDSNVTKEAVRRLRDENPDVLFLHFDDTDHSGHQFGFGPTSPQYVGTIKLLDGYVGKLTEAIRSRPRVEDESWLIVVTTDHGGIKTSHGGQLPEERQIFAFFNGPGFRPASVRTDRVYQTLVAPSVLDFLGIPVNPAWGFAAESAKQSSK